MKLRDTLGLAFRSLRANALRTALAMLGIVIGVGAVVAMVAVGTGASHRVGEQIRGLGSNMVVALSGTVTAGGVRLGSGSQPTLTEDDAKAIERNVPGVRAVAPSVRGSGQVVFGNMNWSTVIQGATPAYFEVRDWEIAAGKVFSDDDVDGAAKVAVIGETVAQALFGDADPVDEVIRIKRVPFTVVGVLDRKGQTPGGQDQDDVIVIPISTAKKRVLGTSQANSRTVGAVAIKVEDPSLMKQVEEDSRSLLRQRHRLAPHQDDDFFLRNLADVLAAQEGAARVLAVLLAAIASISLVVGGIGIMNVMLVSVTERTREIGLRIAVGARSRDILRQFLVEAIVISAFGGVAGVALGAGASFAIGELAEWPTLLGADAILLAFGFAGAVGVFFGYYPARKAALLDPIEALRYE